MRKAVRRKAASLAEIDLGLPEPAPRDAPQDAEASAGVDAVGDSGIDEALAAIGALIRRMTG